MPYWIKKVCGVTESMRLVWTWIHKLWYIKKYLNKEKLHIKSFDYKLRDLYFLILTEFRSLVSQKPWFCLCSILSSFDSNMEFFQKRYQLQKQIKEAGTKEFIWPDSFPDCTPALSNIDHHLHWIEKECSVLALCSLK